MSNVFFNTVQLEIESYDFTIVKKDFTRPWGGFLVIDETQAQDFSNRFFDGIDVETLRIDGKLSPKILIVKPEAGLSWKYHHRRAEIWQVFRGTVGIIHSEDDNEGGLS
jgi:mannose-6-phosphate isomerase-like protein (cupin superfamily)